MQSLRQPMIPADEAHAAAEMNVGERMYGWARDLFPICRSLTGDGVRQTLRYFQAILPELTLHEVPSGTNAFDWTVPDEWNIHDAYVQDVVTGERVIDFQAHNLHVMGYSEPVDQEMSFADLDAHLYSLPEQPDAIPYITSYYKRRWGFCLTERQRETLRQQPEKRYRVVIESRLQPGHLTYGELLIPGERKDEILLSTYVCHPSMGNNELSGPCVAAALAEWVKALPKRRYSYRILFLVETIGSIVYLSRHWQEMKEHTRAGFVLTCVGDEKAYSYVASRLGNTLADRVAQHVLKHHAGEYEHYSFLERGSDERQYCSAGIDLPVCSVIRSKYGVYPEYHTSLDDLSLITPLGLQGGYEAVRKCLEVLEGNDTYRTTVLCEPQLGKRGLYPTISTKDTVRQTRTMMNLLAYADGEHSLLDIAEMTGAYAGDMAKIADTLLEHGVIEKRP